MSNLIKYILAAVIGGIAVIGESYFFPTKGFIAFVVGWLFLVPAAFIVYMVYRLLKHMIERSGITVSEEK